MHFLEPRDGSTAFDFELTSKSEASTPHANSCRILPKNSHPDVTEWLYTTGWLSGIEYLSAYLPSCVCISVPESALPTSWPFTPRMI